VVVLLAGRLGARLERETLEMVLQVLAESVSLGMVAPTVLLARLGCTSVAAGVQLKKGNDRQVGHCLELRSLLLCLREPSCHGH